MLSNHGFLEHEIPYRQLDKLGISKENILALNKDILSTFMTGGFTPLLKMEVEGDGKTYIFLGKLRMSREPKGASRCTCCPCAHGHPTTRTSGSTNRRWNTSGTD